MPRDTKFSTRMTYGDTGLARYRMYIFKIHGKLMSTKFINLKFSTPPRRRARAAAAGARCAIIITIIL
eukprot:SAG31_NODE_925_length_10954_cov_3.051589_7_plen_68_part_00